MRVRERNEKQNRIRILDHSFLFFFLSLSAAKQKQRSTLLPMRVSVRVRMQNVRKLEREKRGSSWLIEDLKMRTHPKDSELPIPFAIVVIAER